jgi:hypothetical protein
LITGSPATQVAWPGHRCPRPYPVGTSKHIGSTVRYSDRGYIRDSRSLQGRRLSGVCKSLQGLAIYPYHSLGCFQLLSEFLVILGTLQRALSGGWYRDYLGRLSCLPSWPPLCPIANSRSGRKLCRFTYSLYRRIYPGPRPIANRPALLPAPHSWPHRSRCAS